MLGGWCVLGVNCVVLGSLPPVLDGPARNQKISLCSFCVFFLRFERMSKYPKTYRLAFAILRKDAEMSYVRGLFTSFQRVYRVKSGFLAA